MLSDVDGSQGHPKGRGSKMRWHVQFQNFRGILCSEKNNLKEELIDPTVYIFNIL